MENDRDLKTSGQSTVEYLLLIGVMSLVVFSILNSSLFKSFFGSDADIFKSYKNYIQYTYRHGQPGSQEELNINYNSREHDSYYSSEQGQSRFFILSDPNE